MNVQFLVIYNIFKILFLQGNTFFLIMKIVIFPIVWEKKITLHLFECKELCHIYVYYSRNLATLPKLYLGLFNAPKFLNAIKSTLETIRILKKWFSSSQTSYNSVTQFSAIHIIKSGSLRSIICYNVNILCSIQNAYEVNVLIMDSWVI